MIAQRSSMRSMSIETGRSGEMDDESAADGIADGVIEVSTDRARLDVALIHRFLSASSYWALGRSLEDVERSIAHSFCFGAFTSDGQIGFGRVVTDFTVFGYLADVFVIPEWRGKGVGRRLVRAMLEHPRLNGVGLMLRTKDAHPFYQALGFGPPRNLDELMARYPPQR
jgi:GNAT superfamily N-acetyltransferase